MSEKTPALATTPHPLGKPDGPGLFHVKGLMLPPYIQNIARAMIRQGHTKSQAIQLALGAVERWKDGGGSVSPEVRAAAAAAWAQWLAARATAKAKPNKSDHANDTDAVELTQPRVPTGNTGAGQWYGEPEYPVGPRTREVPTVTVDNLDELRKQLKALFAGDTELSNDDRAALERVLTLAASVASASDGPTETGNSMGKNTRTVPAGKASLEDRLHRKLVARGIHPTVARKMAKRAAARVIRERITGPGTPAAAALSRSGGNVIDLAEIHQWKHGWIPLTPYAAAIKAKMAHGSTRGHSPDLPKALHSKAAELHSKHGKSVVHGSYGHSEIPTGHASRKAAGKAEQTSLPSWVKTQKTSREDQRIARAAANRPGWQVNHMQGVDRPVIRYGGLHGRAHLDHIGGRFQASVEYSDGSRNSKYSSNPATLVKWAEKETGKSYSGFEQNHMEYHSGRWVTVHKASEVATAGRKAPSAPAVHKPAVSAAATAESKVTAKVEPKKVTPESKRAAERKTLSKDERKAYNKAAAEQKAKYAPAARQHMVGMAAAKEHTAAKQRAADIAHYTPEQRAIYDRETSRYGSRHHEAMRTVDVLMKERAAAREKKAAEDAKKEKDLADFKAGLGSMSTEQLRNVASTSSGIVLGFDKRKATLAGAELQRRASASTAERLAAKPDQVIGGAGLHKAGSAPNRHLVKQDGKVLGIVEGRTRSGKKDLPTPEGKTPTHYRATTVGRWKPGSTDVAPKKSTEHTSLADAVAEVQKRGAKIPKESKADQASLFDAPKTGRSTKAPAMAEGELGGPIKFEGGRTGTVWADAPKGGKWVIPDERQPGEAHAIYVDKTGKVHAELSSAAHQKQWLAARKAEVAASTPNARAAQADKARKLRDAADRAKVGEVSPEEERAALSDAQRRVYDITRNQILAHGPSLPNEKSVHARAMQNATNDRLVADYERGRAHMQQQQADRERAAFRRSKSVSAMRKAEQARQSATSAATGSAKLSKVPDSDLLSSLQAMRSGPDFGGRNKVIAELEAEIRRRGLKVPASASLSLTGGTVIELAKVPARLRAKARQKAADNDTALPDGSWPIRNRAELAAAIQSWGRAVASGRSSTVKAWILKRAKALGASQDVIARIQALEAA